MPLYEYFCRKCGTKFERLRPMSRSDEPATCPCGHEGAERVLSMFAAFKGSEEGTMTAVGGGGGCGVACSGGHCACSRY